MTEHITLELLRSNPDTTHKSLRAPSRYGIEVVDLATFVGSPLFFARERFRVYENNAYTCVSCCATGTHVLFWSHDASGVHADLIGLKDDRWTLFTKDHIIPRFRGGSSQPANLQTMCAACNSAKATNNHVEGKQWA